MTPAATQQRLAHMRTLLEVLGGFARPAASVLPAPPVMPADPAGLAKDSAASSVAIAQAAANLGTSGDDQANADRLWTESLQQIARIQRLYRLPPLPFQASSAPEFSQQTDSPAP